MQRVRALNAWNKVLPLFLVFMGLGILGVAFSPGSLGISNSAGLGSNQIAIALGGIAVLLTGIFLFLPDEARVISDFLFLVFGVLAAAFAADLISIRGLPGFLPKHFMVGSVIFGLVLTASNRTAWLSQHGKSSWLNLSVFNELTLVQIGKYLSLVIQFALLLLVIQQFKLENQAFYTNIIPLAFYGFIIHSLLPQRLRLPFFLGISIAAILGVLGFQNGMWLIGLGLSLIGITHLPISFNARLVILLAAGILITALRVGWLAAPWSNAIWPIFGSIFMFRLIVYAYERKHAKNTGNIFTTLSYFFLLPNIVFPLFPVVDYATFRKTYYDGDAHEIYQSGLGWIFWGSIHLVLYRAINYYAVISPESVTNGVELYRYIVSNLMLLLRISGQFHLIIGILHLFGFHLPRVMHDYFLASSFTDLWRRANIYWKDFMLKVFYYPLYFRLKNLSDTSRLVIATLFVFVITWFLHAYQWFWLRGSFLLTAPDISYWTIFGLLVLFNILRESKMGRKRTLGKTSMTGKRLISLSFSTAATFLILATLWSLWTSPSIADWISLWSVPFRNIVSFMELIALFGFTVIVFGLVIWLKEQKWASPFSKKEPSFFRSALGNGVLISAFLLIGYQGLYTKIGGRTQEVLADLTTARLSNRDAQLLVRGYYEDLIGVDRFNTDLWEIYTKRPAEWPRLQDAGAARETGDFKILELVPSTTINFHGAKLTTNRWGMRDRDYAQTPAPNTHRIVLLGPSFVMGSGVADEEVFEWYLEDRFNQDYSKGSTSTYEILNFAVAGHSALQELWIYESQALSFAPSTTFYVAHQLEEDILVRNLADRAIRGVSLPYDYLVRITEQAGVKQGMSFEDAERLLTPYRQELLSWTYDRIVTISQVKNILPVWIFMPTLEAPYDGQLVSKLTETAQKAGFTVLALPNFYEGKDISSLIVAEWDLHPNAKAHRLIADQLNQAIQNNEDLVKRLGLYR